MEFKFDEKQLQEVKSYAQSNESDVDAVSEDTIDCSMGVNPYGFSSAVKKAYDKFELSHFANYPHSHVHYEAVKKYWSDMCELTDDNIFFCNGSVAGIYFINAVFSRAERKEALGFAPTFTDTVESMKNFGMTYKSVPMHIEDGGSLNVDELIAQLGPETGLVYIDRPHNPTGQSLSLEEVEKLVKACRENGTYCLMDEAYGDFISKEEASVALFPEYDNLMILKTFSKGFGLANVRMGYLIADKTLIGILNRLGNPYILNDLEREIIAEVLSAEDKPDAHGSEFAAMKEEIRKVIGNKIEMLKTDGRVPICTLHMKDGSDLLAYLKKHKILAVPGAEYENLDASYVRFRVPEAKYNEKLLEYLKGADK